MTAIDVVLPVHEKDRAVLARTLRAALAHLSPVRRIYVVSQQTVHWPDARVMWSPEPADGQLPTLDRLHALWSSRCPKLAFRASWLYQQLLKLGAGSYIDDLSQSYLVLDADVIFLRSVSFAPSTGVRFPYSLATENHGPYHDAHRRLLGAEATTGQSMIAHHMLFDRALLAELHGEIEARHKTPWYEAFLAAVDYSCASPISEMNLYGWWMLERHPELACQRQVRWRDVQVVPTALERVALARRWDFVAAHAWMRKPRWRRCVEVAAGVPYYARVPAGLAPDRREHA
jgi:hypothetical protein